MIYSQVDADLASVQSLSDVLDKQAAEIDAALLIVEDISSFGLTHSNFSELRKACPDLEIPDVILSSIPVKTGSESVATEAIGSLGALATAGILTVLAAAIGWIVSKMFGGDSGGGGGFGGGALSKVNEMSKNIPAQEMYDFIIDATPGNSIPRNAASIACAANFLLSTSKGDMDTAIKVILSNINLLLSPLSNGMDDDDILKITAKDIPSEFNAIVKDNPFVSNGKIKGVQMNSEETLELIVSKRKSNLSTTKSFRANVDDIKVPKGDIPSDPSGADSLRSKFKNLSVSATAASKKVTKLGKTGNGSKEGYGAIDITLKHISKYITDVIIPSIARSKEGIAASKTIMGNILASAPIILKAFKPEERAAILKASGVTEDDLKEMEDKDKYDKKHFEMCMNIINAIGASSNITNEIRDKIKSTYNVKKSN